VLQHSATLVQPHQLQSTARMLLNLLHMEQVLPPLLLLLLLLLVLALQHVHS
jgi:hypothetical protein